MQLPPHRPHAARPPPARRPHRPPPGPDRACAPAAGAGLWWPAQGGATRRFRGSRLRDARPKRRRGCPPLRVRASRCGARAAPAAPPATHPPSRPVHPPLSDKGLYRTLPSATPALGLRPLHNEVMQTWGGLGSCRLAGVDSGDRAPPRAFVPQRSALTGPVRPLPPKTAAFRSACGSAPDCREPPPPRRVLRSLRAEPRSPSLPRLRARAPAPALPARRAQREACLLTSRPGRATAGVFDQTPRRAPLQQAKLLRSRLDRLPCRRSRRTYLRLDLLRWRSQGLSGPDGGASASRS